MTNPTTSTEVRLARRPQARAVVEDMELVSVELPEPAPGEVLVRNTFLSVDPYMRNRMNDIRSYVPPFALGEAMTGGAVGRVVASRSDEVPEGALVSSTYGWREGFVAPAGEVQVLPEPPAGYGDSVYLGLLGMTAMTAWVGLTLVAPVAENDTVFISAASGAVGSIAGQLARARGAATVIGSAGSADKVAAVTDLFGFDAAFSYRDGDPGAHLRELAPRGIDVYFDNVGGEQLDAALVALRPRGRIALCGAISSGYGGTPPPIHNLGLAVGKRLRIGGFIVSDHGAEQPRFLAEMTQLLAAGSIVARESAVEGISAAPQAFLDLFDGGGQIGKVVVAI